MAHSTRKAEERWVMLHLIRSYSTTFSYCTISEGLGRKKKPTNYLYTRKVFIIYWQNIGQAFTSQFLCISPCLQTQIHISNWSTREQTQYPATSIQPYSTPPTPSVFLSLCPHSFILSPSLQTLLPAPLKKKKRKNLEASKLLFSFFILHPSTGDTVPSFALPYINFHLVHPRGEEGCERVESWKTNDARYPTWQKREKTPTRISAASGVK